MTRRLERKTAMGSRPPEPVEDLDVLIVGAGISGVGAAWHIQHRCPGRTYAIFEARAAMGGTWDLFRYPGIRSDSDMYTFGYAFRPWVDGKVFADGPAIRSYIEDTAREAGIDRHIRFGRRVVSARWDSPTARWTVEAEGPDGREIVTARFLMLCSGYYRYDHGYMPEFEGLEDFTGRVIHPQLWREGTRFAGQRVVVIGSGATAVTLVPAMADEAAHVTMLQRSPSYIAGRPQHDAIADALRKVLPGGIAYGITRYKNIALAMVFFSAGAALAGLRAQGRAQADPRRAGRGF